MAGNEVLIVVRAQDLATKEFKAIEGVAQKTGSVMGTAMKAGALAAGAGVVALGGFLASSVKEAMESQKVVGQLEAVLKSTGSTAGLTSQQIQDMAAAFQKQTVFGDEAILSAQNLLLTFTQIKGPQFEGATQAVLDMATAMGTDLNTAAIQVGKALNDPIQGVGALRRVGVQLTDQQEEQIKVMMEAGDVMGAQKVILGELSTQFGGSAAAAADTFGGRMQQLKNRFGEMQERLGMKLLPVLMDLTDIMLDDVLPAIERISPKIEAFGKSHVLPELEKAFEQLKETIRDLMPVLEPVFNFFKENEIALYALIAALGVFALAFGGPVTAILGLITVGTLLLANWDEIKAKVTQVVDDAIRKIEEIPIIGDIFRDTLRTIEILVETWVAVLINQCTFLFETFRNLFHFWKAVFEGDWAAAWDAVKAQFETTVNALSGILGIALDALTGIVGSKVEMLKGIGSDIGNAIIDGLTAAMNAGLQLINELIPNQVGFSAFGQNIGVDLPDNPLGQIGGGGGGGRLGPGERNIRGYASGGIVPGPVGAPQLAVVHGGERISPAAGGGDGHGHDIIMDGEVVARLVSRHTGQSAYYRGRAG